MIRVIGRKNVGAGIVYIVLAVAGIAILVGVLLNFIGENQMSTRLIPMLVFGVIFTAIGGFLSVKFLSIPMEIIKVDSSGRIYLPKGVTLYAVDIVDISYKQAKARHATYSWGDVIISTRMGAYTCSFVSECEAVAKELSEMMYRAKFDTDSF